MLIILEWPPYSSITAPVSPGGLQKENHKALSGTSIPFHSCRFGRLIISPDGDEAKELKSITYQTTHKLYSAPSKTENENQIGMFLNYMYTPTVYCVMKQQIRT